MQDSTINILVDSVSTLQIDGQSLKVQHVSQLFEPDDEFQMNGEIIENIGWTGFMFPLHSWADPPHGGPIRCFQNDSIYIRFLDIPCDYLKEEKLNIMVKDKTWVFLIAGDYPNNEIYTDWRYKIGNDTVIGGIEYSKLLFSQANDNFHGLKGFIREEENGKVYFRDNSIHNNEEYLLYDFGMEPGDTAHMGWSNSFYQLDSTGINNDGRKVYYFTGSQFGNDVWIEGVGSTQGLLREQITGGSMMFSCCLLNGEQLYHNPDFESCYYTPQDETVWAPIGAEWYYTYPDVDGNPLASYEKFVVKKDTVVEGKECKIIGSQYSSEIMYEEDGKVFYWFKDNFKLIYDFTAKVRDTIDFEFKGYSVHSYIIDTTYVAQCIVTNIDSELINDIEIKKFYTTVVKNDSLNHMLWPSYYNYQERIGFEYKFMTTFELPSFDGPHTLR